MTIQGEYGIYHLLDIIGSGVFATVFKARWESFSINSGLKDLNTYYAVKVILKDKINDVMKKNLKNEVGILRKVEGHENFVKLVEVVITSK